MLPYKQSYFRLTYDNKFYYRIIYIIIFEAITYIKSNGSLLVAHFCFVEISLWRISTKALCSSLIAFIINGQDEQKKKKYIEKLMTK